MEFHWLLAPPLPADTPRQRLIYQRLREAILAGRLAAGTRLPASRQLAASLGIARNTVLHAYEQLLAEGCLTADRTGTRVARLRLTERDAVTAPAVNAAGLSRRALAALQPQPDRDTDALPFSPGVSDYGAFPFRAWRASLERAWRDAGWRQLGYSTQGGDPALRGAIADYLTGVRGLAVEPGQVVVTAGTQAGLDLCGRLLADAGDTVWVENPGYLSARVAFALAGLQLHYVVLDEEGLAPAAADWQRHAPRLITVTPSHQYPTGRVMSLARRLSLIEHARASGSWIIEDDYDSEFRRGGPAPPALFGLQAEAPVVYAGTFSKTLYPGLRLGYLVLPRRLAAEFSCAASQATLPGQGIEQRALADFMARGHYTRHLRRMRARYAARQSALRAALAAHLGGRYPITGGDAGLHLCLWLPAGLPDVHIAQRAATLGLGVRPLSTYAHRATTANGLVLGYGSLAEGQVDGVVARLALALAEQPVIVTE